MVSTLNPQPSLQPSPPQTINANWIRFRSIGYLRGKGVSFGINGPETLYPAKANDVGKYSIALDVAPTPNTSIVDTSFGIISRSSLDHVFIGNRLAQFANPEGLVKELVDKLREGGHLVMHAVGDKGEALETIIKSLGYWQRKALYHRADQTLGIWKLQGRQRRGIYEKPPSGAKRACICRYGAIGDMIMISPLIKQLAADGYEVTMNITPYCAEVLRNNPYISNIVLQERDAIPNQDLGDYWNEWMGDYEKYINLSESIEGKLIKVEGRRDFYTTKQWRMETCGSTNYYDQTMKLGGYPEAKGLKGEIHFSRAEEKEAAHIREKYKDKFLVLWSLKGSSYHKVYPLLAPTLIPWLDDHPDAMVILCGAEADKLLQFVHPQIRQGAGELPIRTVFALTKYVDLVVGPESAVINAAGCWPTPKIPLLTHSTHTQLCQYWENDYCLAPEGVECYPCHQLHYNLESCPVVTIKDTESNQDYWTGPICAALGVTPPRLQARLTEVHDRWLTA